MSIEVVVALVGVGGALLGSIVGGLLSFIATRNIRRMEWRFAQVDKAVDAREHLYSEFLAEGQKLMLQSVDQKLSDSASFSPFLALLARIQFVSNSVGKVAVQIVDCVITHHQASPTPDAPHFPKLRDEFVITCRADIQALEQSA